MAPCRDGDECPAFERLIYRGDRLEDPFSENYHYQKQSWSSFIRLYGHPARDRYGT